MAVKYPEIIMIIRLLLFIFNPKFSAYKSPNIMMFNVLDKNELANNPVVTDMLKNASLLVPTAENEPIPQMTKA